MLFCQNTFRLSKSWFLSDNDINRITKAVLQTVPLKKNKPATHSYEHKKCACFRTVLYRNLKIRYNCEEIL
jgi:hypothetical protein